MYSRARHDNSFYYFFYRISFETLSPSPTRSGFPHRVRFDYMDLATRILLFRSISLSSSSSAADVIIRYSAAKKKKIVSGRQLPVFGRTTKYIILHYRSYRSVKTIEYAIRYYGNGVAIDDLDHGFSSAFSTIIFLNDVLKNGLLREQLKTTIRG